VSSQSTVTLHCLELAPEPVNFARQIPMLRGQVLPDFLFLSDSMLGSTWRLVVHTNRSKVPAKWSDGRWAEVVADSIDIMIPTQSWAVGVFIRLPKVGKTRTGRAWRMVDTPSVSDPSATVVAKAVRCPTSMPRGTFPP
jgi:hypothetical protein